MDFPCPEDIKKMFKSVVAFDGKAYLPEDACRDYFKWLNTFYPSLRRGDRVEVYGDDEWVWWAYNPDVQ